MSAILLGLLLSAGSSRGDGWTIGTPESAGVSATKLAAMDTEIRGGEFRKIGSVLVARNGKIVHEAYYEGDADTLRNTRSATKSVTAILTGIAIDRKLLSGVDVPVSPFLSAWKPFAHPDPRKDAITVAQLLTMSSALDCNDWIDSSPGNEERMYPMEDWVRFGVDLPVRSATSFSYCTAGTVLLGAVLESAAHMPVDELASKFLFGPLGIERAHWTRSPRGMPMTGGGLELRSRDLLKLGELWRRNGDWNGTRVVSAAWVQASTRPHSRIDDSTEYGYLFWVKSFRTADRSYPAYLMTGNGGNKVAVFPELQLVAVLTSTNYNARGMHQQTDRLLTDYVLPGVER